MAEEPPYLVAPKRFPQLLETLQTAAVPDRLTAELLKKLGYTSSNDRAFPSLLKRLGFLDQNAQPTNRYRAYRNKKHSKRVLAEAIREAYADLFALHTNINSEDRESVKGVIGRITQKEQRYIDLMTTTFMMLCERADFSPEPAPKKDEKKVEKEAAGKKSEEKPRDRELKSTTNDHLPPKGPGGLSFRYNIEIHLPATTDISVYNAIFKSLKDNLGE